MYTGVHLELYPWNELCTTYVVMASLIWGVKMLHNLLLRKLFTWLQVIRVNVNGGIQITNGNIMPLIQVMFFAKHTIKFAMADNKHLLHHAWVNAQVAKLYKLLYRLGWVLVIAFKGLKILWHKYLLDLVIYLHIVMDNCCMLLINKRQFNVYD